MYIYIYRDIYGWFIQNSGTSKKSWLERYPLKFPWFKLCFWDHADPNLRETIEFTTSDPRVCDQDSHSSRSRFGARNLGSRTSRLTAFLYGKVDLGRLIWKGFCGWLVGYFREVVFFVQPRFAWSKTCLGARSVFRDAERRVLTIEGCVGRKLPSRLWGDVFSKELKNLGKMAWIHPRKVFIDRNVKMVQSYILSLAFRYIEMAMAKILSQPSHAINL